MRDSVFSSTSKVLESIQGLNSDLEKEMAARQQWLKDVFEEKKVAFEKGVLKHHRRLRTGVLRYLRESQLSFVLTAPVIYAGIIPLALVDLFFTLYQYICFSVYDIPKVQRSKYLVIDRQHLAYLNLIEKVNCVYCGYGNGVIAYAREIAARTEEFWCPIKHAGRVHTPHHKYYEFLEYGDGEGYRAKEDEKNRKNQKRI
ncbi:MAG: hypothetical protein HQ513_06360 [Rhodospirillales bacterium]|nr:hypothetical protein [Rhodospirillales bacterium]